MFINKKVIHNTFQKTNASTEVDKKWVASSIVNNPVRVTLYLIASIFLAETIVMFILMLLPTVTGYKEALLDAFLLTIIITPTLYHFVYKPFQTHLKIRQKHESNLISLSLTDELTGSYNRRGFFNLAEQQFKIAARKNVKVFMMYLDVDNFKEINDSLGHDEGDNVLIIIASILNECFRETDIIARIGGDEFVIFPIGNSEESINIMIDRLNNKIAAYKDDNKLTYNLSVSIGVTCYDPDNPCSMGDLLNRADKQMYKEKKAKQYIVPCYNI